MEAEAAAECWDKVQVGRSTLKVNVVKNKKPNVYSIHALWFLRVPDTKPVLKRKGFFGVFEYSSPLFFRKFSTCS